MDDEQMTIKIYNPRLMMRGGVSNMMEDARTARQ